MMKESIMFVCVQKVSLSYYWQATKIFFIAQLSHVKRGKEEKKALIFGHKKSSPPKFSIQKETVWPSFALGNRHHLKSKLTEGKSSFFPKQQLEIPTQVAFLLWSGGINIRWPVFLFDHSN